MSAPQPEPLMVPIESWAALRVLSGDVPGREIVLSASPPDVEAMSLWEIQLSTDQAVALIERLVGIVGEIRSRDTPDGAGPLSSTY